MNRLSQRTVYREVLVKTRDLFAENHAIVLNAAFSRWEKHASGSAPPRVNWNGKKIIRQRIALILGDDERGSRLVRIFGLARGIHCPNLAPTRVMPWKQFLSQS